MFIPLMAKLIISSVIGGFICMAFSKLFSGKKKEVSNNATEQHWEAPWKNTDLGRNLAAEVAEYTAHGYDFSDPRLFHQKLMKNMQEGGFPFNSHGDNSPADPATIEMSNAIHETAFAGGDSRQAIEEYVRKMRDPAQSADVVDAFWNRRRANS